MVIGDVRIDFAESRFVPPEYYESLDPIRRPRSGDLLYTLVGSYVIPVIVRDDGHSAFNDILAFCDLPR